MPRAHCVRTSTINRTPRVVQLESMFDVPPSPESRVEWDVELPIEEKNWNVGLIVGPSGCGKSTLAREWFGKELIHGFEWPADQSLVDAFPVSMGIKEITSLLSSVGFSSPPSWLRPFHVLSNGEQFRVTVARALAEQPELAVIDEFTSVVDRQVAQIGSHAVQKTVRRSGRRLVAVACHYDIIDWLDPDWIFEPHTGQTQWRSERQPRPQLDMEIVRVHCSAWELFKPHHYLSGNLHKAAACFMGIISGRPAAFCAVLPFPHPKKPGWREHRTVVLPDFQGLGLGSKISEYCAGLFSATGKPYRINSSHPAVIQHRLRSPLWRCTRKPSMMRASSATGMASLEKAMSRERLTAGFEYTGPRHPEDAAGFGLPVRPVFRKR